MTPLRQKFIDEIDLRGLSPLTRRNYVSAVERLAKRFNRPPDQLSDEDIKDHLLHLIRDLKLAASTVNIAVSALRLFYGSVLQRSIHEVELSLPRMRRQTKRPQIYSIEEIERLFGAPGLNLKHRALLMTAYAAGLRVSEVCRLQPGHLLSSRMQIRVEQGKGRKDRYTVLSHKLLEELRAYWRIFRPGQWLFPSQRRPDLPVTTRSAERVFSNAVRLAGLPKRGGIHCLRHSFATHLLEQGVDLPVLQRLLGHRSMNATAVYLHVSHARMQSVRSPLDLVDLPQVKSLA